MSWPKHRGKPSDSIREQKAALYRTIGMAAREAASDSLASSEFHAILKAAIDMRVLTVERVIEIARVDRTTASRWINKHNTPGALIQSGLLLQIDVEATNLADELTKGEHDFGR